VTTARRSSVGPGVRRLRDRADRSLAGRVWRRFVAASGFDRSLALATQAFVALIPASLLAIGYLPGLRDDVGAAVIDRLGLTGDAAGTVQELATAPPDPGSAGLVGGIVLIVITGLGFTRALQRLHIAVWALPPLGFRGYVYGVLAVLALVAAVIACVVIDTEGGIGPVVQAVIAMAAWLPIQGLLLGGRVTLRQLLPGAVVVGAGQTAVMLLSGPFLKVAIASQTGRFGVLGIAFVVVSWLLVLAYLLVGAAVLSAELAGAPMPGAAPLSISPAQPDPQPPDPEQSADPEGPPLSR
jgi:membrane protein